MLGNIVLMGNITGSWVKCYNRLQVHGLEKSVNHLFRELNYSICEETIKIPLVQCCVE